MKCTSAEAAKYLRKLNEDYASLLSRAEVRRDFLVSLGEDPESVRPPCDFRETQDALDEMEQNKQQTIFFCCSCLRCSFLDISLCYPL